MPHLRLKNDKSFYTFVDQIQEVYNFLDISDNLYETICRLSISTPLTESKHVDQAIDYFDIFEVDSVISVVEEFSTCYSHIKNGLKELNQNDLTKTRMERDSIYIDNGAITLFKTKNLFTDNIYGQNIGHISMLPSESLKLNTSFDFWLAEKILKEGFNL